MSKLEDDLKNMVKSIREVQTTIGTIDSSKKVSEVNESLVNANDSMTIIIKLSDTFYTVISHMKDLNKELEGLNRQTASNPIAATVGSLDARIRGNMKELRKQLVRGLGAQDIVVRRPRCVEHSEPRHPEHDGCDREVGRALQGGATGRAAATTVLVGKPPYKQATCTQAWSSASSAGSTARRTAFTPPAARGTTTTNGRSTFLT